MCWKAAAALARFFQLPVSADVALGLVVALAVGSLLRFFSAASREMVDKVTSWVIPGESLVGVIATHGKVSRALEILRQSQVPPVFFIKLQVASQVEGAIDADVLASERLRESIQDYARREPELRRMHTSQVAKLVEATQANLTACVQDLSEAARLEHTVTAVAEELINNAYLTRSHIADVRRNLPKNARVILPALASDPQWPRILLMARTLVRHFDGRLTRDSMIDFLQAYQQVSPLQIAELWVFPLMVRLALLEVLQRLTGTTAHIQDLREISYLWGNRLAGASRRGSAAAQSMLEMLAREPYSRDSHFLSSLQEQLRDQPEPLGLVQKWAGHEVNSIAEIIRAQHSLEASDRVWAANAFSSLRMLQQLDFAGVFEAVCLVEDELRRDPAEIHAKTDFATRDRCRRAVEDLARTSTHSEIEVARRAISIAFLAGENDRARHVGHHLIGDGAEQFAKELKAKLPVSIRFPRWMRRHSYLVYFGGITTLTVALTVCTFLIAYNQVNGLAGLCLLLSLGAIFPISELVIQIVNAFVVAFQPPRVLPKLDFKGGVPASCATLVAVPTMLSSAAGIARELEKLEVRFLGNRTPDESGLHLYYALVTDFNDAPEAHMPEDAALRKAAVEGIEALNRRYSCNQFLLFHRDREWSQSEQAWIGKERKRGKIEELNAFLYGEGNSQYLCAGELNDRISYVITLDADTQLPAGTAARLIGTIAHPLNKVELTPDGRDRVRGYAIIQPRVSIALPDAMATRFTRIFNDTSGTDPYCRAISDAYQDLFGEAIFHGKAIYDVRAFHQVLHNRFPAETLLSHDLIEGVYVGVGLASDIEVLESFPLQYSSYIRRQHRWTRGDWQISPWIRRSVPEGDGALHRSPLSGLSRWKIFDNLRRSLVAPASILILVTGWLLGVAPAVWSIVVAIRLLVPAAVPLINRLATRLQGETYGWRGALDELRRAGVEAAVLPHQAWTAVDAIARAWYRRHVSHRHLLEWQTAEVANLTANVHVSTMLVEMTTIRAASIVLGLMLLLPGSVTSAAPFLLLWVVAPDLLRFIGSQPSPPRQLVVRDDDRARLRLLARRTWRFFDDFVNESNHWLPPDNYQFGLRKQLAQRTSPTNIGLWLTSSLAACDFGYVTLDALVERLEKSMDSIEKLERYDGHPLNWYDTTNLLPLEPRYVSTVDSGNLLASLWVLAEGLQDLASQPVLRASCLHGTVDALEAASATVVTRGERDVSTVFALRNLKRMLESAETGIEVLRVVRMCRPPIQQLVESLRWSVTGADERTYWLRQLDQQSAAWHAVSTRYLEWMETLASPSPEFVETLGAGAVDLRQRLLRNIPSLRALAQGESKDWSDLLTYATRGSIPDRAREWLLEVSLRHASACSSAEAMVARMEALRTRALNYADAIDMRLVYDASHRLFGIGYRVGSPREFQSHYDLLASECRLTSLVAVAKGDVSPEHWFDLGRPYATVSTGQVLLSWSGTMFEYLMPLLYTRSYPNSLLENACRQAVSQQIAYASQMGVPWGISESAYSAVDQNQTFQYRAFGVPDLALKSSEAETELVVSPYSTVLALMVNARAAVDNLERLEDLGLGGTMGMVEAMDYTRESERDGSKGVPVQTYMAHHQGMSLLSLNNVLNGYVLQNRFHSEPRVRAVESLLFERIPSVRALPGETDATEVRPPSTLDTGMPPERVVREDTAIPRAHLLGNGRYSLMITSAGGGYSRWNRFDISRWYADTTTDAWGSFCYVRDKRTGTVWSTTYHPVGRANPASTARFAPDRVGFSRIESGVETEMELTVSPEDDAEVRRVRFTNRSLRTRAVEVTSYVELALAEHAADRAHPAFSKMFIETESVRDGRALLAHRRLRSPDETAIWAGHLLVSASNSPVEHETDRETFLGRGRTPGNPAALDRPLNGITGTPMDPIFSLRQTLILAGREQSEITFITLAGESRDAVLALIDKYLHAEAVYRAFEVAWTHAQLDFRYLGIDAEASHRFQELASHVLYPNPHLRAPSERLSANRLSQPALWAHGISGDLPMVVVTVGDSSGVNLVREILLAHAYWRLRGLMADLIILDQESPGYFQPLLDQLRQMVEANSVHTGMDRPGGVFLRSSHHIPQEDLTLLYAAARVNLSVSGGGLVKQLGRPFLLWPSVAAFVPAMLPPASATRPLPFLELPYFNGIGGFTQDGKEYAIYLEKGVQTPAPWINVIANPRFGALVSESGPGLTWYGNSQQNRLTTWSNDPVSNPSGPVFYLRDEDTGELWTPTPLPIREDSPYRARHGQGYTAFEYNGHGIEQNLSIFVPAGEKDGDNAPVLIQRLNLRNYSNRRRQIRVTFYSEWTLGTAREDSSPHVNTWWDVSVGALFAANRYNSAFPNRLAFATLFPQVAAWSADRTIFLGRNGRMASPAALGRVQLAGPTGAGFDPCAALQVVVTIDPGQSASVVALLGDCADPAEASALIGRYGTPEKADGALARLRAWWDEKLTTLTIRTPVLSLNLMMNRWLLYQTLACRVWARSGFYQSGGAFGFRDQLQDSMALVYAAPELARQHLIRAAGRQFPEGDVQHWWHPQTGLGVRTLCSDDLLWLPYTVSHYVTVTGDVGLLREEVPYLAGQPLDPNQHERLFLANPGPESGSIWDHCLRAVAHAGGRGPHGLPLIGNGDWNDGMNRVGVEGKGESVWLAWFLIDVHNRVAGLADRLGNSETAREHRQAAKELAKTVEGSSWDGHWYLRAFFDDGTPMGSHTSEEAKIDSLPQSWAVLSGAGDKKRAEEALKSAEQHLVQEQDALIQIFTPPFDHSKPHPGYIMGYPQGVRENGGQYTHAAVWFAMAFAHKGDGTRAVQLLQMLNPVEHAKNKEESAKYRGEPYVLAADVYSAEGRVGQAGWTWYTGSASWLYRAWLEEVLGFQLHGSELTLNPKLPDNWPGFEIDFRYRSATYAIRVTRGSSGAVEIDGKKIPEPTIVLTDDGRRHEITLTMTGKMAPAMVATPAH